MLLLLLLLLLFPLTPLPLCPGPTGYRSSSPQPLRPSLP